MAANSRMIHIRVDDEIRDEASAVLETLGMSMSDAIRLFLHRVVVSQSFPLELKAPNEATRSALKEAREMRQAHQARFASPEELFADLGEKVNAAPIDRVETHQRDKAKR